MPKLILCTVGTSVFDLSKYPRDSVSHEFERICSDIEKNQEMTTDRIFRACPELELNRVVKLFVDRVNSRETRTALFPAEIASLMKMMILKDNDGNDKYGPLGDGDKVALLFSDSPEGGLAALLNGAIISKAFFNQEAPFDNDIIKAICTPNADPPENTLSLPNCTCTLNSNVELIRIVGLKIQESSTVVSGLKNLVAIINQMGTGDQAWDKLFNFTAGFKGVAPFAFVSAIRQGFTTFFFHENGREAIYFNPVNQLLNASQVNTIIESSTVSGRDGRTVPQRSCAGISMPEAMVGVIP